MENNITFLIKSCLAELENEDVSLASFFLDKAIVKAEVANSSREDYIKELMEAAVSFIKEGKTDLAAKVIEEIEDVSSWTAPEQSRDKYRRRKYDPRYRDPSKRMPGERSDAADDEDEENPLMTDANPELLEKMNTMAAMMKKFFDLFFLNRLPSDTKKRESEDLKEFKNSNRSKFNKAFDILQEGFKDFQKVQLTDEESDKIEKFLKLMTPLKTMPTPPIK